MFGPRRPLKPLMNNNSIERSQLFTCHQKSLNPNALEVDSLLFNVILDPTSTEETVDALRQRLRDMKRIIVEKQEAEEKQGRRVVQSTIDGNFLSWVFGAVLFIIVSASTYAFYSLYQAIQKKFPSRHTEL